MLFTLLGQARRALCVSAYRHLFGAALAALAAAGPSVSVAQAPSATQAAPSQMPAFLAVEQLQRTLFTMRDGAPQGIYAITQDRDGYLWVGGANGLYRFDGVRFERMFEKALGADLITTVFGDREGALWVGTLRGRVVRINHGVVADVETGHALVTSMSLSNGPHGGVWLGTAGGLVELTGKQFKPVNVTSAKGDRGVYFNLYGTGWDGSYWAFSGNDAYRRRPGADVFERVDADAGIAAMADLPEHAVHISATPTADMIVDRYRALWIPTSDGLLRYHAETRDGTRQLITERVRFGDGEDVDVTADYVDRDGNVWVASSRGLEQFRATRFTPVPLPQGVYHPTIVAGDNGTLWIASRSTMPPLLAGAAVEPHPELGTHVNCFARAADGSVWMSADQTLHRLRGGVTEAIPLPPMRTNGRTAEAPGRACHGMATGPAGDLWMDLGNTIWRWDGHDWANMFPKTALSLVVEADRAWIGRPGSVLVMLAGGKEKRYGGADGVEVGAVDGLYVGKRGLWVSGGDGLMLKRGEHFQRITGTHGERYAGAGDMVERANGDLWLLTTRGLFLLPSAEIDAAIASPGHVVSDTVFDQDDGLRGTSGTIQLDPLEEGTDGRMWLASERSVAWIDPAHIAAAAPAPTVAVETLNGQDLRFTGGNAAALEEGTRSVEIGFTAPTLVAPAKTRFRYELSGIDEGWQDAGVQRRVHYSNLGPGHYQFRIQASAADGTWPVAATTLAFRILPAFYQTWWFRVLCVLALLAALWVVYRRHMARVFAAHQTRLEERERIARDLHDSLLQHFQALLFHAHAAGQRTEGATRERFAKVVDIAEDALAQGREKIMGLRSVNDSLESLPADVQKLAALIGGPHGMTVSVEVTGQPRALRPAVADEVHAIVQELVANAFRHSQGKRVCVALRYERQALLAVVADDGVGMSDTEAAVPEGRWGMAGMRERAREIGGTLVFARIDEGGTRATLRVPARLAYRRGLVLG
ncbi:sensor histidine kinase [Luteibacter aegosomatissinici]|uniref:sensor histidine kinase n=1 Tax=Luteibacter aegosomatissinici TaxID=2911539 RepID=UPI001FFB5321|nr:sensor histidine kinase [Luteibacter aegosomatissinici]UPG92873.1 histidine kinase [Luteibacter aegosomatissinici]